MPHTPRSFSAEFKAQLVVQLLSGESSQAELCRKHSIKSAFKNYFSNGDTILM
jgi:transposase-like protein